MSLCLIIAALRKSDPDLWDLGGPPATLVGHFLAGLLQFLS